MSKKDRKAKALKENTKKKDEKDNQEEKSQIRKEMEMTPKEHKIMTIIGIVGIVVIIILVLVNIPWGGEKERIARKYNLDKDNVYEYIEFDELREKINNKEEFQVLFVNKSQANALDYVFYIDYVVKAFNKDYENQDKTIQYDDEGNEIPLEELIHYDKIYLFDTSKLNKEKYADQAKYLKKNIEKNVLDTPNIVFFKVQARDYSTAYNTTARYKLEDYTNIIWKMIVEYFYDCYEE